ncbi:Patatin [Methylobacterium sp. 4-46]|uniref:patatin-like phospholipase family protein n=1 Tax=unclassified Methylobacterium TaxID=2615210 RepID=UPI000152D5DC|nr:MULTISPECIES: patatin-like phospholipase family protein [Methylobacterium]ACA20583.1 Patatin [Methylobacterium sp. 4-46]WFT79748.1 patatin-like phospholipase family protein [Methylobacterium nodulans]
MSGSTRRRGMACAAILLLGAGLATPATAGNPAAPGRRGDARTEFARTEFTAGDLAAARPEGLPAQVRLNGDDPAAFRDLLAGAPRAGQAPWLVLSGGGENGAYAAGLLKGWSGAGNRPDFGVVTGVSTGALIAPFAFAGARYDAALEQAYTQTTAADVFEFGGSDAALTDTWPLKRQIEKSVTPALLAEVAAEHRKGRRLLVATTELDSGRPVLWDMGAIAGIGGPAGLKLFREVMLASAAVPGLFPPVMIDAAGPSGKRFQEMHADGGTTAPFFLAPGRQILGEEPGGLPAPAVYLVVNNSLAPDFQVASRTMLSVLGRSLSAAIRAQTAAAVALARGFAGRTGLTLHVALIDSRFSRRSPAPFDQGYMRALFAHGEALGRDGTAFDWRPDAVTTSAIEGKGGEAEAKRGEAEVKGGEAEVKGGEAEVKGGEAEVKGGETARKGTDRRAEAAR